MNAVASLGMAKTDQLGLYERNGVSYYFAVLTAGMKIADESVPTYSDRLHFRIASQRAASTPARTIIIRCIYSGFRAEMPM